ncbi:uncharacterized protein LOC133729697 [Rosa rugosa]|uniref:uncharacterized protein LOC133729697 n=1 Tax=Rosa rugosa TaxID=74645 RepID=UPI002B40B8BA|nr:uncharacterized protein LOC133729697 [Rosa rugosa]
MSLTNEGASKKKADSDSEEDNNLKEKGVSNKKKEGFCSFLFRLMPMWSFFQLQRRMKIAELKRLPDVVEVWDATAFLSEIVSEYCTGAKALVLGARKGNFYRRAMWLLWRLYL